MNILIQLIKGSRPVHWVKNFALFAALIFSGVLLDKALFEKVVLGFISFSLITSAAYLINDVLDAKHDKLHPVKKNRPVASGKLPAYAALSFSLVLAVFSFILAQNLGHIFFLLIIAYIATQITYSLGLKNIPIIDILIIASGFIMRVYSGAFIIDAHLSVWFLLCVVSVALFLASGKRRAELNILETTNITRKSLLKYDKDLLNAYVTMFGNAAWLSWALFAFFESPKASLPVWLVLAEFSRTTTVNKLLMITIPIVIFGIMRYQHLIFQGKSEMPEKLILTDYFLLGAVAIWLLSVIYIFYGGVAIF